jgi:hypothetical protein
MTASLTSAETLHAIRQLPRDTTLVVERNVPLAEALHAQGLHVVLVGAQHPSILAVPSPAALNDHWSAVTCRNPSVAGIGGKELQAVITAASERTRVNAATSTYRARGWAQNLIRNLRRLTNPLAMALRGLDGVPAFIVGAGSSLDLNHALLPECAQRGLVIAVNAASRLPGVDMALTVESNDVRHKLGPLEHVALRAFATSADPDVMAHGHGQLAPVYAGELGDLLASLCGVPKLACSALGGTAAVALAERLGCDPIVLVGHDFEAVDGGLIYPECLGLGSSRTHRVAAGFRFDWDESLRHQRRHNPLNEGDAAVELQALGGGTTTSTGALAGTLNWYAQAGDGMGADVQLINASERGACIRGWEPWTLREVIDALPVRGYEIAGRPGATDERISQWLAAHARGIEAVERAARGHDVVGMMAALRQAPLVEPWCQAQIAEVMAARREAPMHPNPWREWSASRGHEADIMATVLAELPGLVSELGHAAG